MEDLFAFVINLGPPSQVDEQASGNILDRPEVKGRKGRHQDEGCDFIADDCVQENEAEYRETLEHKVKNADGRVVRR